MLLMGDFAWIVMELLIILLKSFFCFLLGIHYPFMLEQGQGNYSRQVIFQGWGIIQVNTVFTDLLRIFIQVRNNFCVEKQEINKGEIPE